MTKVHYADALVEIRSSGLFFRHDYFPFGSKTIPWDDIERIAVLTPSLPAGKWRIHGTGDFRTWFPRDAKRPSRDAIFLLFLKHRRRRIGFTVEQSHRVRQVLDDLGFSPEDQVSP